MLEDDAVVQRRPRRIPDVAVRRRETRQLLLLSSRRRYGPEVPDAFTLAGEYDPIVVGRPRVRPVLADRGGDATKVRAITVDHPDQARTRLSWRNSRLARSPCLKPLSRRSTPERLSHLLGDIGGILGSDALRAMGRTTIDYAKCQLTVGGAMAETGASTRIPLTWHQGRPVIAVGEGARLLLDSGATTVTVFSDTPAAAGLRWSSRLASIVRVDRLDGAKMGRLGELACLSIGGVTLRGIPAVAVNSWYDKRDERARMGSCRSPSSPGCYFTRRGLHRADPQITPLTPLRGPPLTTPSGAAYTFPHTQAKRTSLAAGPHGRTTRPLRYSAKPRRR